MKLCDRPSLSSLIFYNRLSLSFYFTENRCCGGRYMPSIKPDGSVNSVPQSDSNGLVAQYALPPQQRGVSHHAAWRDFVAGTELATRSAPLCSSTSRPSGAMPWARACPPAPLPFCIALDGIAPHAPSPFALHLMALHPMLRLRLLLMCRVLKLSCAQVLSQFPRARHGRQRKEFPNVLRGQRGAGAAAGDALVLALVFLVFITWFRFDLLTPRCSLARRATTSSRWTTRTPSMRYRCALVQCLRRDGGVCWVCGGSRRVPGRCGAPCDGFTIVLFQELRLLKTILHFV
jgi:hypothetical protein